MIIKSGQRINYRTSDILKKPFDAQNSTVDNAIKEIAKQKYSASTIGGTVFYSAIIIETIDPELKDTAGFFPSVYNALFGDEKMQILTSYRVFIPELHSGLGAPPYLLYPADTSDQTAMNNYAINSQKAKSFPVVTPFFPADPQSNSYQVGDAVWVLFQNSRTNENGFIFGKINQTANSAPSGLSGEGMVGENDESSSRSPQDTPRARLNVKPDYETPQQAPSRIPPNMDTTGKGRFLIDYSKLIEIMSFSKGYLYRFGTFPEDYIDQRLIGEGMKARQNQTPIIKMRSEARKYQESDINNFNANWADRSTLADMYPGVDCSGFVRNAILAMGILVDYMPIEVKFQHPRDMRKIHLKVGDPVKYFLDIHYTTWVNYGFWRKVEVGQQLPGDIACHSRNLKVPENEIGMGHTTLVVSYPVETSDFKTNKHSYCWGSHGEGGRSDGCLPWNGVGVVGMPKDTSFDATQRKFTPVLAPNMGGYQKDAQHKYFRINPIWIKEEFRDLFKKENNGYKVLGYTPKQNIEFYDKMIHNPITAHPAQFDYPKNVDSYAPAVIKAKDNGLEKAKKALSIMKDLSAGRKVDLKDDFTRRVYIYWGNGEGPGSARSTGGG